MRLSLRFILPLAAVLGIMAVALVPITERFALKWFVRDLDVRAELLGTSVEQLATQLLKSGGEKELIPLFDRLVQDERLMALGLCDAAGAPRFRSATFPSELNCSNFALPLNSSIMPLKKGSVHVSVRPVVRESRPFGNLILVHDMSFIERRSADTKKYIYFLFIGIGISVSMVSVLVAQLSWQSWVSGTRSLFKNGGLLKKMSYMRLPELRPIAKEFRSLVKELESTRRVRDESQVSWTPRALKNILQQELAGEEVLIVSNRQPYIHKRVGDKIEVQVPASGLVTALEPVMRACSGTWIAHGSGSADRDVVDENDRVRVPPDKPTYSIRRVWLSKEEEEGYYYGFSNEGLWPLCHIAHTRPTFRTSDWNHYVAVNQKFADAIVEEAKTDNPVILVQDYHFALLPKMVRERIPDATIITFWHIPWPNPEAFSICPWRDQILQGMLGSSILGFHTRFHCNNFIETVDRFIEARIDRASSTISHGNKLCAINHYPISIEWPSKWVNPELPAADCRHKVREKYGISDHQLLGIGVDRLDYTKGIQERFLAIERLLELKPEWIGRFTFLQIAAPSRSALEEYQRLDREVRSLAERINSRFGADSYQPICLVVEHREPHEVFEFFRAADVCMVSSLHDGMNLVAKEFVASREDERGVLILSQFTGAARELPEALIVNPYDIDQCAAAFHVALKMPVREQADRMKSMRALIQEFNVYRWAGKMLIDAARSRQRTRFTEKFYDLPN